MTRIVSASNGSCNDITNEHEEYSAAPTIWAPVDPLEFVKTIAPPDPDGKYCVAHIGDRGAQHSYYGTAHLFGVGAANRAGLSAQYFALHTFGDRRNAANARLCQVVVFDIDPEADEASAMVLARIQAAFGTAVFKASGLTPWFVVDSGRGWHVYFLLAHPVDACRYIHLSRLLQGLMRAAGLVVDPAVMGDPARLMRLPGTVNQKTGRTAQAYRFAGATSYTDEAFEARIVSACPELQSTRSDGGKKVTSISATPLSAGMERRFRPYSFAVVASKCGAMQQAAAIGGGTEPMWRAMLGLIKYSTEGAALAHQISAIDPRYDEAETQRKLDGWTAGPPTCQHTQSVAQNPVACAACKFGRAAR